MIQDRTSHRSPLAGGLYRYHLLRAASDRFQSDPTSLSESEKKEAERLARRTLEIEDLVLASREARRVPLPPERLEAALAELRGRYADPETFVADLHRNGLDQETLAEALRREVIFDTVMQSVAARHAEVDEIDERLFYELHRERFGSPERRAARHILITLNDAFEENRREAALARIARLADKLRGRPPGAQGFASLARKHSECPTALDGGRLGEVGRGQLYPELDALLFRLPEGQLGGPVESELGFHLLYCERVQPARTLPFSKVRETIRDLLVERRRRHCQKAWLAELHQRATGNLATPGETAQAQ